MKKKIFFCALLGTLLQVRAQTVLDENFESAIEPEVPVGWSTIDLNGDSSRWVVLDASSITDPLGFSGKVAVVDGSYFDTPPDDLIISPLVNLSSGNNYTLSYDVGSVVAADDPQILQLFNFNLNYAVYILPEGHVFLGSETPVFEETISDGNIALNKTVDISNFTGQNNIIYFRVFGNSSPYSATFILDNVKIIQGTLSIAEVHKIKSFHLFPNPTSDYLKIKSEAEVINISVMDLAGKKLNVKFENNTIDVRSLPSGAYIVSIQTVNNTVTEKFIKK